jgi:N-acetylglucosaminyldiphosphoundecaprenol N-acetyl-beta-D-mannosaminyltransferase
MSKRSGVGSSRISIIGVPVDNIDMDGAVCHAQQRIKHEQQCTIFAMNPEKAIAARENGELYQCLDSAGLLIPDGIGIILASRLHGIDVKERVPGSELMPRLCEMAAKNGYSIFLFGAQEEVNKQAAITLMQRYPGLCVADRHNGYITEQETPELINKINASGAKLLFVALGSPRQEYWMQKYKNQLNVFILQGVGGTFDVISGQVKRAPKLWRALYLEWLYRLLSQPQRCLRQSRLPAYVWLVLRSRFGLLKF